MLKRLKSVRCLYLAVLNWDKCYKPRDTKYPIKPHTHKSFVAVISQWNNDDIHIVTTYVQRSHQVSESSHEVKLHPRVSPASLQSPAQLQPATGDGNAQVCFFYNMRRHAPVLVKAVIFGFLTFLFFSGVCWGPPTLPWCSVTMTVRKVKHIEAPLLQYVCFCLW